MSCRSGCFCTKKATVVHSSKPSSGSKPVSSLRKETSSKPSAPPLYYRGGNSGYSKPSAPQSKLVSRSKPVIKPKKEVLSKPGHSGGSSNTKPSASSCCKPSGKTKNSSVTSTGCGRNLCNSKPSAPLNNKPVEKSKEPSTKPSSIASTFNAAKHYIASQSTSTSPPSTKPKNSTKSSVVVKITVRTPQTTIEQETAFDIDT